MAEATTYAKLVSEARRRRPRAALVLGSGLGDLADRLEESVTVPFLEIPGLAGTSVAGHRGELLLGTWMGQPVAIFAGRLHYYEGHPWRQVVEPVQIAKDLGVEMLILTNAVGGIRDDLAVGSLMAMRDHIECTQPFWWRGSGPGCLGEPRPSPYSPELIRGLQQAAEVLKFALPTGVYAQMTGPSYETKAEIRALRGCGADVVGMSTAREIQVGYEMGLACAGISCVTNRAAGLSDGPIHHGEVLETAANVKRRLTRLIEEFLRLM